MNLEDIDTAKALATDLRAIDEVREVLRSTLKIPEDKRTGIQVTWMDDRLSIHLRDVVLTKLLEGFDIERLRIVGELEGLGVDV